ncbi:hypothetical protein BaRGS_00013196, partial [Batillaria attramentaria]
CSACLEGRPFVWRTCIPLGHVCQEIWPLPLRVCWGCGRDSRPRERTSMADRPREVTPAPSASQKGALERKLGAIQMTISYPGPLFLNQVAVPPAALQRVAVSQGCINIWAPSVIHRYSNCNR